MFESAVFVFAFIGFLSDISEGKIYERCEFVRTLRQAKVPDSMIPTFTCIANFESHFNTQARNLQTNDFGIFQISAIYWCNDGPQKGKGCNQPCSVFMRDEIWDAIGCARQIYEETKKLERDGFSAWTVWKQNCSGDNQKWIAGC